MWEGGEGEGGGGRGFFFNDTATTEIYTLSLHDALPIYGQSDVAVLPQRGGVSLPGRSTRQAGSQPEPLGLGELLQGEPDERRRMAGIDCNGWLAAVFHKDD